MKTILVSLATVVLCLGWQQAEGAEWVYYATTGKGASWFLDKDTLTETSKDTYQVWVKTKAEHYEKGFLYEIDCKTRQIRTLGMITFRDETPLHIDDKSTNRLYETPETIGEALSRAVCPKTK